MRDYLHAHVVEFDDRNIRHSDAAREELRMLRGDLAVPVLVFGEHQVVGFDPESLDEVIAAVRGTANP